MIIKVLLMVIILMCVAVIDRGKEGRREGKGGGVGTTGGGYDSRRL